MRKKPLMNATVSMIESTRATAFSRCLSNTAVSSASSGLVPSKNPTLALDTLGMSVPATDTSPRAE